MLQQQVAAFPGPDLDESRSLQLADHLGPGHLEIVNLPLGFVNARTWLSAGYETVCERCSALAHDIGRGFIGAQIDEPRMAQGPALKQR